MVCLNRERSREEEMWSYYKWFECFGGEVVFNEELSMILDWGSFGLIF